MREYRSVPWRHLAGYLPFFVVFVVFVVDNAFFEVFDSCIGRMDDVVHFRADVLLTTERACTQFVVLRLRFFIGKIRRIFEVDFFV